MTADGSQTLPAKMFLPRQHNPSPIPLTPGKEFGAQSPWWLSEMGLVFITPPIPGSIAFDKHSFCEASVSSSVGWE